MDALWQFARRDNKVLHLKYDSRYIYRSSTDIPILKPSNADNVNTYLSTELLAEFQKTQLELFISKEDVVVKERAWPLSAVGKFVKGDIDKKYFKQLFGFKHIETIIRTVDPLLQRVLEHLARDDFYPSVVFFKY